ncbi:hypothetical protein N7454_005386 [Penicillium verhagenii]|nr:hypothetical protein N7454_005386 [Penicillium verhagenii]
MSTSSQEDFDDDGIPYDQRRGIRPQLFALNVEARNDRAASSQRRNLLFAAYGSEIYVWIPSGPLQLLGTQPEMIIHPVMRDPTADGYIDRSNPHTINAILVDDLGLEEILLLGTDSGNVCAYHVEAIYSAVVRCASRGHQRPFDGSEVTPFFTEIVGMSAWGLATHKYARLIAVSANTGQITVFAFALVDSTPVKEKTGADFLADEHFVQPDRDWFHVDTKKQFQDLQDLMPVNHRSRNLRISYRGHYNNIPSVSFANFDLDANGEWMVSTDITNRVIIWRIWDDLYPHRVYYPGHPENNPPQRGWTVLPLDPRTFKRHQSPEDACGCTPTSRIIGARTILNLSRGIAEINDASQVLVTGDTEPEIPEIHTLPDDIFLQIPKSEGDFEQRANANGAVRNQSSDSDADFTKENQSRSVLQEKRPLSSLFEDDNEHYRVTSNLHRHWVDELEYGPSVEFLKTRTVHPNSPSFYPVLHFSEHNISLAPYPLDSEYHLLSKSVLFQTTPISMIPVHSACDRFNMVKYIPELGIVVAASQKGRVAIVCLTWQEEVGFAFRVDWIVPFLSQERQRKRPIMPLLGIAVSPMPGFENPADVPSIPQGIDPDDWLSFNYRSLDSDDDGEAPPYPSSSSTSNQHKSQSAPSTKPSDRPIPRADAGSESESESESQSDQSLSGNVSKSEPVNHGYTLAELHAEASSGYRPQESWHGCHSSRHYRLFLLYVDHTVMSYEFWHEWKN